jgi:putative ABC transport system permease protein
MDALLLDLRTGFKSLSRSPVLAAAAVLALALGIGASAAIYAFIDKLVLRPFSFPVDRLAMVTEAVPGFDRHEVSAGLFEDWRAQTRTFERLSAYSWWYTNLTGVQEPEHLLGYQVTPDFFETLGVQPSLGRGFAAGEDQPGRSHVAVLSHELWQRRFGGDRAAVGRTAILDGESFTVVGVMPDDFRFPKAVQLWAPLVITERMREQRGAHDFLSVGRLRPGATVVDAQRELSRITEEAQARFPGQDPGHLAHVFSLRDYADPEARLLLWILFAACGLLLLISCANVALLLLARGAARGREIAIRAALGATRGRVVRQLLTESLLLAAGACALGLVFASWGIDAMRAAMPASIARFVAGWTRVSLDARLFAFCAAAAAFSAVVASLVPALKASRLDLQQTLQREARAATGGRERRRLSSALVAAQIALAVVLVVDAGLFLRTLRNMLAAPLGFDAARILTLRAGLAPLRYALDGEVQGYYDEALRRIRAVPGVESAGAVSRAPLGGSAIGTRFSIDGVETPPGARPLTLYQTATEDYLESMRIPVLAGRPFGTEDRGGTRTAIVSEALARKYFGGDALGHRIRLGVPGVQGPWRTIVGVVGSVRHVDIADEGLAVYVPLAQDAQREMTFVVRTQLAPASLGPAVRAALLDLDPDQPVSDVAPLATVVADNSLLTPRYAAGVLGVFAAIALLLSAVGVYGVMAVSVSQREQEMGIRMALGAQSADVLKLVLSQGLRPALAGVLAGAILALASGRALEGALYGVASRDPLTLGAVCLFLLAVAAAANWLPARRATRVDPMIALRAE